MEIGKDAWIAIYIYTSEIGMDLKLKKSNPIEQL